MTFGADGIALSNDGSKLYYCVLSGRQLYSVSLDALSDRNLGESEVAATVEDLGEKGASSDRCEDLREKPYRLFRIAVDAEPVLLK